MNQTATQNFLNQLLSLWINPEIELRKGRFKLPSNFSLNKAQIIFTLDGHKIVRLNEEIKAVIETDLRMISNMNEILDNTQESVKKLDRISEEEDFAHTTIVKVRDLWVIAFDFRYGISSSKDYYELGNEYLNVARNSFDGGKYRPAALNLFIAMENLSRARIFLYPDSEIRSSKTHRTPAEKVNIYAKEGKIMKPEYGSAFNYIKDLYDRGVRYKPNIRLDRNKVKSALERTDNLSKEISLLYQKSVIYK